MGLSHGEFGWHLPASETHLARHLHEQGYDTALIGFQHITTDERIPELGFDQWHLGGQSQVAGPLAVRWLEERARTGSNKPFYLEIAFGDTHRPWGKHPPDWNLGTERLRWLPPYPGSDEEMAEFQGEIRAVDEQVGAIVGRLDATGLRRDTWVIFTSDHGIDIPRAKGTLYDPGIEVPLIMQWPTAALPSRRVLDPLISHVDIVPTILQALGISQPSTLQGHSFWPLLSGHTSTPRKEIYAEKTYHTVYDPIRAVRTDTHKLIVHFDTYDTADVPIDAKESPAYAVIRRELTRPHRYLELFNLETDPLERDNLAGTDGMTVLSELLPRLYDWMRLTGDPLLEGRIPSPMYRRALDVLTQRIPLAEFLATLHSPEG